MSLESMNKRELASLDLGMAGMRGIKKGIVSGSERGRVE